MKNLIPFLFVFGLVLIGYQKGDSQENSVPEIEPVDWPVYRGDNSRAGFVSAELQTKKLEPKWQWTAEIPPQPAWDGPARWDAFAELRDLPAMRQYDACFHTVSDGEKLYLALLARMPSLLWIFKPVKRVGLFWLEVRSDWHQPFPAKRFCLVAMTDLRTVWIEQPVS